MDSKIFFFFFLFMTSFSWKAAGQDTPDPNRGMQIFYFKGDVAYSLDGENYQAVEKGLLLKEGQFLKTEKGGSVILIFGNQSKMRLDENSLLQVKTLLYENNELKSTGVLLKFGQVLVKFIKNKFSLSPPPLTVETPIFATSIRGTQFFLSTAFPPTAAMGEGNQGALAVSEGQVEVMSFTNQQKTLVDKGKGVMLDHKNGNISPPKDYPWMKDIFWELAANTTTNTSLPSVGTSEGDDYQKKSKDHMKDIFTQACEMKNADACAYVTINYSHDVTDLEKNCQKGSAYGCFFLGQLSGLKKGVPQDREKAFLEELGYKEEKGKGIGDSPTVAMAMEKTCLTSKDPLHCFRFGKLSPQEDYNKDVLMKEGTGYQKTLMQILAQHCGKNDPLACSQMNQFSPYLRPTGGTAGANLANEALRGGSRSGTSSPTSSESVAGTKEAPPATISQCFYENPPVLLRPKNGSGPIICSALARCLHGESFVLMNLACPAQDNKCPKALECGLNEDVLIDEPVNANDLPLWNNKT